MTATGKVKKEELGKLLADLLAPGH